MMRLESRTKNKNYCLSYMYSAVPFFVLSLTPHDKHFAHMTTPPPSVGQPFNHFSAGTSAGLRLPDLQPRKGRLIALRTKAEAQAPILLIDAYIVELPLKSANSVLK